VERAQAHEIKSWDEVFGRPLKKGKQQTVERKKRLLGYPVLMRVWERHAAGEAISKPLFEAVGRELGVSGTVAAEIYYKALKGLPEKFKNSRKYTS
jgi:hypothetical protein